MVFWASFLIVILFSQFAVDIVCWIVGASMNSFCASIFIAFDRLNFMKRRTSRYYSVVFFSLVYFSVECSLFTVFHGRRIVLCCTMCKCAIHSLARRLVDVEILVSFVSGFDVSSPFIFLKEIYSYPPKMVETTTGKWRIIIRIKKHSIAEIGSWEMKEKKVV